MAQENEELERRIIELEAARRLNIPISSMSGKLKRREPKLALAIRLPNPGKPYRGERVHARIESEDIMKARKMNEAIAEFAVQYPSHGKVLYGLIAQKRLARETHLYFGMNDGCRLTTDDYIRVMAGLGFGEVSARALYHELIEVSRTLSRKREETERRILIGPQDSPEPEAKEGED